eukprot:8221451-Alexandrium_andersonii.AAC.1
MLSEESLARLSSERSRNARSTHCPRLSWDSWRRLGMKTQEAPRCAVRGSPGTSSGGAVRRVCGLVEI